MASPGKSGVSMRFLLLAALSLPFGRLGAAVQDSLPPDTVRAVAPDSLVPAGTPIVVRGDTLFRVFGRLGLLDADLRAAGITARLDSIARNYRPERDSLHVVEIDGDVVVMAGDMAILAVLPADAVRAGVSQQELAAEYLGQLSGALSTTAFRWQLREFGIGFLKTLLTLVALGALVWLLRGLHERLLRLVNFFRHSKRIPSITLQQLEVISADKIADALLLTIKVMRGVILLLVGYLLVVLVLGYFPWTKGASGRILDYVVGPLGTVGTAILDYLPNVFFVVVIVLVTKYILKGLHFFFNAVGSGAVTLGTFDREWAEPTYKLVRFLVLAFALIAMFPYLPGSKSDAFKGVSLFMGVLLSLGSTGAVANLVAGTLLTYSRSFQIGDRVRIGDTLGDVVMRTLLVTKIRTSYNVEVTIPNSKVMSGDVLNYSTIARTQGVILRTTITIGYDVPWRRVHELLVSAALSTEGIEKEPAPFVLQTGLNDYYPAYELNTYVKDATRMRLTLSALNERVQDVFAEAKVEITSPAYTAIRDGNAMAIPPESLATDYVPGAFSVRHVGSRPAPQAPGKTSAGPTPPTLFEES
jgi:small-conductance mechanosensitive channel